jgi:hypothetical protein
MDIHELCERIVADYEASTRKQALAELRAAVTRCISALWESGRLPVLAAYDRDWIVAHVDVDIERLLSRVITEQDIEQMVDEALAAESLPSVLTVPIPDLPAGELWEAVEIDGLLYCCDCRSLYEGRPRTEGELDTLREDGVPFCSGCGFEL